jgi:BolA protein
MWRERQACGLTGILGKVARAEATQPARLRLDRRSASETAKRKRATTMAPTAAEQRIREKLMVALEPTRLDVINESELHAGHRNSPDTGESHFRLVIVSAKFAGRSRLERHRLVNEALAGEMGRIHALAIGAFAPGEALRV